MKGFLGVFCPFLELIHLYVGIHNICAMFSTAIWCTFFQRGQRFEAGLMIDG